jgi:hypothetical protein
MGRGGLEREEERVARRAVKIRRGWFSGLRDLGLAAQKHFPFTFSISFQTPF